jgi:hypothetical protein
MARAKGSMSGASDMNDKVFLTGRRDKGVSSLSR